MMTPREKFEKYIKYHPEMVYYNNDEEFCFCQDMKCTDCMLITDCADEPITCMPPFITQEDLMIFKYLYPEMFI